MSARDVIAEAFSLAHRESCYPHAGDAGNGIAADLITAKLIAAGYSIVHESEIHGATRDRCEEIALAEANKCLDKSNAAKVAGSINDEYRHNTAFHAVSSVADAIRALPDGGVE